MFKKREFLKSAAAAPGAVSAWVLAPVSASSKTPDVPSELDLETAIYRWSKKSEYSNKRLTNLTFATFYRVKYAGSRDLGAIRKYVTDYHDMHQKLPRGCHVVTHYFDSQNPFASQEFDVYFALTWGDDGEPLDFLDARAHPGLTLEEVIDSRPRLLIGPVEEGCMSERKTEFSSVTEELRDAYRADAMLVALTAR